MKLDKCLGVYACSHFTIQSSFSCIHIKTVCSKRPARKHSWKGDLGKRQHWIHLSVTVFRKGMDTELRAGQAPSIHNFHNPTMGMTKVYHPTSKTRSKCRKLTGDVNHMTRAWRIKGWKMAFSSQMPFWPQESKNTRVGTHSSMVTEHVTLEKKHTLPPFWANGGVVSQLLTARNTQALTCPNTPTSNPKYIPVCALHSCYGHNLTLTIHWNKQKWQQCKM